MNFRLLLGRIFSTVAEAGIRILPPMRSFPKGWFWTYDILRFSGTRKQEMIFDVGANVGQTALLLHRFFPASTIYAFEPVSSTFDMLKKNTSKYRRIRCLPYGLGEVSGERSIQLQKDSGLNSLTLPVSNGTETERIKIKTVDEFVGENNIACIDILKLDTEGYELQILDGASAILKEGKVHFIFSEAGFRCADGVGQTYCPRLLDKLRTLGFAFCGFYDLYRFGDKREYVLFGNMLFVNPNYSSEKAA